MNQRSKGAFKALCAAAAAALPGAGAFGQLGTAFTWQGRLLDGDTPASGVYDFQFALYDDAAAGLQVGSTLAADDVNVNDGQVTLALDFGTSAFNGDARWLEIAVKADADISFTTLSPRQPVHPTPYAQFAISAASAATVPDGGLTDTYTSAVNFTNASNSFAGTGSALTDLNASNISSGNLADARLPTGGQWSLGGALQVDGDTLVIDPATKNVSIGSTSASSAKFHVRTTDAPAARFARNGATNDAPVDTLDLVADTTSFGGTPEFGPSISFHADDSTGALTPIGAIETVWWNPDPIDAFFPESHLVFRTLTPSGGTVLTERMRLINQGMQLQGGLTATGGASLGDRLEVTAPGDRVIMAEASSTIPGTAALHGTSTGASDFIYGVAGFSNNSPDGTGVLGFNNASSGAARGVWGISASPSGHGVRGEATAGSGVNYGVYGTTSSPDGYAGYFVGDLRVDQGEIIVPATARHLTLPGTAFGPNFETIDFFKSGSGELRANDPGAFVQFTAPVNLPTGANVSEVTLFAVDDSGVEDMIIRLFETELATATSTTMAQVTTTSDDPSVRSFSSSSISSPAVDNSAFLYSLEALWTVPASTTDLRLLAVRIRYDVTSPLP